ncbi:MAG: CHAT domain-containing protein [Chloracidobacterium sp.]|nr:CHAT domain-containing protein [Chloracidobacterium sp.]
MTVRKKVTVAAILSFYFFLLCTLAVKAQSPPSTEQKLILAEKTFNEANVIYQQGTPESLRLALEKFESAVKLFRDLEDKKNEAKALLTIGEIYIDLGERAKALDYLGQTLAVVKQDNDTQTEAPLLNSIGEVYDGLGEYNKAIENYEKALVVTRQIVNEDLEAIILSNIGLVYIYLGERQKALDTLHQSLEIKRKIGNRGGQAVTLGTIGGVYYTSGENQEALKYFTQSLVLIRQAGNKTPEKKQEARSLKNIGAIYIRLGEYSKAFEYLTQSLLLRRQINDKDGEATTLRNLMNTCVGLKLPRYAAYFGKQSVNVYQQLRANIQSLDKETQRSYLNSVEDSYRSLAENLIAENRLAEAEQTINSFKDQQFFDLDSVSSKKPVRLTLTPREADYAARYEIESKAVTEIDTQLESLKNEIGERQPNTEESAQIKTLENDLKNAKETWLKSINNGLVEFATPPDDKDRVPVIADLVEMQAALTELSQQTGQKTVAVYQFVGTEKYRSLLITPDSIDGISYPVKGMDLNQKALQLWRLLQTPDYDPQPIAAELYKMVFEPLAAKLPKDTKTILWSMDGNLRYVPMATLHDGKGYLVERFNNAIFTRADKERLTRSVSGSWTGTGLGSSKEHKVEILGKKFTFEPLFGVKNEMTRIFGRNNPNGIFPGEVLLDAEFTKAAMLSSLRKHRPLVHIASHFKFEAGDDSRSFLILGDGSTFTLDEMKNEKGLFGGVELLTLSACQTAAQRPDATGKEVDGFAELAQRLGAGSIMASLWELSDDSTAELMTRFYRTYNNEKTSKTEALRKAQLSLLKGYYKDNPTTRRRKAFGEVIDVSNIKIEIAKLHAHKPGKNAPFDHPFYWAPFIIIGNFK